MPQNNEQGNWLDDLFKKDNEKTYQVLSEYLSSNPQQQSQESEGLPIFGNGVVGNVVGGAGSAFLRGFGDLAQFVGADNVGNTLTEGAEWIENRLPKARPAEASLDYATDPSGLPRATGDAVGSLLSILIPTAVLPGGAVGTGARLFSKIPGVTANMGKWATRGLISGIPESAMEAGGWERNALVNGMNPDEAAQKSWGVFGRNLPFLMASNAIQGGILPKIFGAGTSLSRRAGAGLADLFAQAGEEGVQQGIQNEVSGKPYSYNPAQWLDSQYREQLQAAKEGFAGFLVPTMGGVGIGAIRDKYSKKETPSPQQEQPRTIQDEYEDTKNRYYFENPDEDYGLVDWARNKLGGDERVINKIIAEAKAQGVDPRFALGIGKIESDLGQNASTSEAGAIGVMQLMPETARGLGVDPYNEDENIRGGVMYLKQMLDMFNGDPVLAAAAYNAGPGAVQAAGGVPNYGETQNYAEKIQVILAGQPEYSGDGNQTQGDNIYTGENGQAEGKYWARQNGNVSFDGAQPELLNAVDMLAKWYFEKTGKKLVVTAGTNGDHPSNGSEHGHDAGWKVDVNDFGFGEEGALTADDGGKGYLTDEFIAYGRSLGLGMNWEGDHIDIALDGNQWDGNGENAGGFNPARNVSSPAPSTSRNSAIPATESAETDFDSDESETEYKPIEFKDDDELTQQLFDEFANGKNQSAENENLFADFFGDDNKFINTQENRDAIQKDFGEEFDKFIQAKGYKWAGDENAPQIKTRQEQPKPSQEKIEFDEIKPPEKKYLNSDLISQAKLLREYAIQKHDGILWEKIDDAIKSNDTQALQKFVDENPLPEKFVKAQQPEETPENANPSETPISETKPAENKKVKAEIPNELLEIARKSVDENNSAERIEQGKALIEIAKRNKFKIENDGWQRTAPLGYKKSVRGLQNLLKSEGLLGEEQETTSDKISKLQAEFNQRQKELDEAYENTKKISEGNDLKTKRQAWQDFNNLRQAQQTRSGQLADAYLEAAREGKNFRDTPQYRKVEADYQNEIDEVADQMKTVKAQGLKLHGAEREDKVKEFKALEKQKKSLMADLHKFQQSSEYLDELHGRLSDVEDFIEEGEKNTKLTKQRDAIQKQISELEKQLGINQPAKAEISVQPTQVQQETPVSSKIDEQPQQEISQPSEVESQPTKATPQQNQEFDNVQQQTKQVLSDYQADQDKQDAGKSEQPAPTSKKTYHFNGTQETPKGKENPETADEILQSLSAIHEKLKTDSHPNLKSFVDKQAKILRENPDDGDAKGELKQILSRDFTDNELEDFENQAQSQENETAPAKNETSAEKEKSEQDDEKKSKSKISSRTAGKSAKVIVNDKIKEKLNTRYKIVENSDLIASHVWDGDRNEKNPKYPNAEELQPRDRAKADSALQLNQIARNLDPTRLETGENVNQGAPVVRNDGVILNGNGRFLSIDRAYSKYKDRADEYKNYLVENAEKFGLNPDEVSQMKKPVLIREVEDTLDPQLTSEIVGTTTGGTNFRQEENAKVDAKKIKNITLKHYIDGGTFPDLQYEIINDIAPVGDPRRVSFFYEVSRDANDLNDVGKSAANKALCALAYNNENLITKIANGDSDVSKKLQTALLESAPYVVQANNCTEDAGYNLGMIIADTADIYITQKSKGKGAVEQWLKDNSVSGFFDPVQKAKIDIIDFIHQNKGNDIRDFLRDIADTVVEQHSTKSFSLLDVEEFNSRIDEIVADNKNKYGDESLFRLTGKTRSTAITNDMLVDEKNLTSQQKKFIEIGQELGLPVKFFKAEPAFGGVFRNGTSYINVNNRKFEQTFYHEMAHYLKKMQPEMFADVLEVANITDEQRKNILDRDSHYKNLTPSQLDEEILAENFMHFAKRAGLLQKIGKQDKNLAEKFISWLKSLMDKFTGFFSNPQGGLTRTQRNAMYSAFKRNIDSIFDKNGDKIFRMNRETFEIQRANGDTLPKMELQIFNENSTRGNDDDFNSDDRYSINPDNNSNESWKTAVENWFLGEPAERLNRKLTKLMQKVTDWKILYRHYHGKDPVFLDKLHAVLRAKNAYDWERLLPVVGGRIAEKLNLPPSDKMDNFIANWLLTGALNNTSAERTRFERAMRENPDYAELLTEIQETFNAYENMSALEQIGTHIGGDSEGKLRKIIRAKQEGTLLDTLTEELIDDLSPLKKIDERFEKLFGKTVLEDKTLYNTARMFKGASGIVRNLIRAKTDAEVKASIEALQKIYPDVDFSKFVPLQRIIANIGGEEYIKKFESYCVACLDKEMYEKNRELEEKARAKGKTLEEKDKYKPVESEEVDDKAIREGKERFGQAQKDLVNFSNTILDISHKSGLLSDKQYENARKNWKNYIPTQRIFDEAEDIDPIDSLKHKRGSSRDIVHPISVIVRNAAFFVNQAEKNKVKQLLAAKVRLGAFGDLVSEEEAKNGNEPTVTFKEDGKTKYLAVTPEIKRAVDSLSGDRTQASYVFKIIHAASRIVSNMYTAASPDFAVGNIFRDAQESYLYNDKAKALSPYNNPVANFLRAFKFLFNSIKKPPEYTKTFYEWQAMGGSQSSFVSFDMDSTQNLVDDVSKTNKQKWISQPVKQFLRSLQEFSERLETANRLAVYEQTKGILSKQNADGKATESDMRRAAFASRNATIDFARGGRSMREVNKYFRFSNVAVQDLAKSATLLKTLDPRNLKTKEGRQKALDTIIKIGFLVLTTAALFMKNHDEDWYKHGTQQWQKDTSWILSDGVKIPKSYSFIGKLTSMITEETLKSWIDDEPIKARRILSPIGEALPSLLPTLLTPIVEAVTNYSFFYGGQLVPQKEMRLPAHMQYNEKTSGIAKKIGGSAPAKFFSEILFGNSEGFSPRKIDHVINGYLGFPGRLLSWQYTWTLDEAPMTKRFLFDPYKNPQIVVDYYNKRSEQERFFNEYKQNRREGRNEKPDGYDEKLYKRIKSAESVMKKISEKERKLIANQKIPADQLKKQLHELEEKRIAICKRVFGYN